jgi:hypothetical protein
LVVVEVEVVLLPTWPPLAVAVAARVLLEEQEQLRQAPEELRLVRSIQR